MGQKINPNLLRTKFYPNIWSDNYIKAYQLREYLMQYFFQKGFFISRFNIYFINNELFLDVILVTSRNSFIFHRRFRKFVKKRKQTFKTRKQKKKKNKKIKIILSKKKKKFSRGFYFFFKALTEQYGLRNIYLKIKRLEKRINYLILIRIWTKICKFTSYTYRTSPFVLNLMLLSSFILQGRGSSFMLNQLITANFQKLPKRGHRRFFLFLKQFFALLCKIDKMHKNCVKGFRLLISGKIGGRTRSKTFLINDGSVPTQTFRTFIDYSSLTSFTILGTFGFKLWIAFRKINFKIRIREQKIKLSIIQKYRSRLRKKLLLIKKRKKRLQEIQEMRQLKKWNKGKGYKYYPHKQTKQHVDFTKKIQIQKSTKRTDTK